MAEQLPSPPVPADADLTHYGEMPLEVRRLRDSGIAGEPNAEVFRCAVLLWCVAWHQLPAGSLPIDDAELCRLVGLGRDLKTWRRIRAGALRGWRKFADSRLYHPVVTEKVTKGVNSTRLTTWSRECDRIRKENKAREQRKEDQLPTPGRPAVIPYEWPPEVGELSGGNSGGVPPEKDLKGKERKGKEEESEAPAEPSPQAAPDPGSEPERETDVKSAIFGPGLRWLVRNTGSTESASRSFLGQLIAQHGEAKTASVLMAAERAKPVDPRSWMKRNIEGGHNGPRPRNGSGGVQGVEGAPVDGIAAAFARRSVQPG